MRRILSAISAVFLIGLLCLSMPVHVTATGGEVVFRGISNKFLISPGSGYTTTDLFSGFKDVMPGDFLTETITVTNKLRQSGGVKLYLRAVPHDNENPLSYSEYYEHADGKDQTGIPGQRDETLSSMADFLSRLTLRVYQGNTLLSENFLRDTGAVYLGTLEYNRSLDLKLELAVPVELDNHYANRVGETDWIFTAEVFENPNKPDIPKTGDMILAAVVIMGISGLLFVLILLTGRRRK